LEFVAAMTGQSLPNILKLFASKKVTGALNISEQDFKSSIWLKDGQVLFAISNQTPSLKDSVKSLNLVSSDKLPLLDNNDLDEYNIDAFLLEKGIIQDKILSYIRSHQTSETLYSIVELEKANYELKKGLDLQIGCPDLLPVTYNWLVEIYQNMYSWVQLRNKIPRSAKRMKQRPLRNQELSKEEEKIYKLCDGHKEIKDVILWSSTTYYKAYTIISSLISKGMLEFEDSGTSMNAKIISEIVKVLDNMEQMPGIKTAFVVDKEGKMVAKDSRRANTENEANSEIMAAIFSTTVSDFENNMKNEEATNAENELIEQLLVERNNGDKTLLFVAGKVILVTEALKDCDWGLLRLSAKRSINSIKQLISMPG
jgi:predicted regulator of Ras-like GTPase activity (Roadblock/LC7/MglB family)